MNVNRVDSTNFYSSKTHFLSDNAKSSVESLLIRMNAEVNRKQEEDYFKSTIITKLHYGDNITFEDERHLTKKLMQNEQMQGFSVLRLGKKTILDIDNKTGEIIDFIKPFYKPWFLVLKQAENILSAMRTNFYDETSITKDKLTINKLTPEGSKKIKQMVLKIEKERLEDVIEKLEEDSK